MEGEGWRVSDEEAEICGLGNYTIWKRGSGQAIISSSSLLWPYWLPSKYEQRLLVLGNKECLYWENIRGKKKKKKQVWLIIFFSALCVFSITKKYPGAPGILRQQWLPEVTVCSLRVNTGCECDMLEQTCSSPLLFSSCRKGCEVTGCWSGHGLWRALRGQAIKVGPDSRLTASLDTTLHSPLFFVPLPSCTAKEHPSPQAQYSSLKNRFDLKTRAKLCQNTMTHDRGTQITTLGRCKLHCKFKKMLLA